MLKNASNSDFYLYLYGLYSTYSSGLTESSNGVLDI
jgi:hypothetical protein